MDAEAIISKYLEIRRYIEEKEDELKKHIEPYKKAQRTLEGAAALLAKQTGQSALKAVSGTAFPVEKMYVRCEDRDAFLDFVFATSSRQMLTSHVSKDAVKEYMDRMEGQLPPGISAEKEIVWQFRRA